MAGFVRGVKRVANLPKLKNVKKKKNSNFKRLRAILTCQPLITIGLDKKKVKNFRTFHSFATKRMTTDENLV
jgi:hypothetical protein